MQLLKITQILAENVGYSSHFLYGCVCVSVHVRSEHFTCEVYAYSLTLSLLSLLSIYKFAKYIMLLLYCS